MSAAALISALDSALLAGAWEEIILRRVVGTAPNQVNIDVKCIARVDAMKVEEIVAGIPATDLNIVISPTQINNAQWPGGQVPALPPFNVDQRVPRINGPDKVLLRGAAPRTVAFCDPKFLGTEPIRINMRVTG
jgi:hypothetical protein